MTMSDSIDVQILHNILVNLVTEPDDIKIERELDEQGVLLSVMVNSKDMGIIIGRSGSMSTAIRTLMRAVGKANKMNLRLNFLEPDGTIRYSADKKLRDDNDDTDTMPSAPSSTESTSKAEIPTIDEDLSDFVIN